MSPLPERPQTWDEAHDRGWEPDSVRHDRATPEPLSPEWQAALDGAIEDARRLRARVVQCARYDCRTSLTEGDAVMCPHGATFCHDCTWEEACPSCANDERRDIA